MVRSRPWSGLTLALACLESLDLPLGPSRKLGLAEFPKRVRVLKVSRRLRVPIGAAEGFGLPFTS